MVRNSFDVKFSYMTPLKTEVRQFKNIPPETFYRLRKRLFKIYSDTLLYIEVYFHGTSKPFIPFCWKSQK